MSSVYDFFEEDETEKGHETVEAGVTGERSDSCYIYTKDVLSFSTWSLTLSRQGKICINLNDTDIGTYVKVKYPDINYKFGTVEECGLSSDETCIKCIGGAGFTVELLWTDHVTSTTLFYKQLNCSSVTYFCESLSTFLKKEQNVFMHAAQSKFLGTFEVDIQTLHCSSSKTAVRSIDRNYACRLYINAKVLVQNGNFKEFPPAIGTVDVGDDSLELNFKSEGIFDIVDGNHTLITQNRLCEEFKDIQSLSKVLHNY